MLTLTTVLSALERDEIVYGSLAKQLGRGAIPYLAVVVTSYPSGLAAKAVYLSSVIDASQSKRTLMDAAARPDAIVRVAAASAARQFDDRALADAIAPLLADSDLGVRRAALQTATHRAIPALTDRVRELADREPDERLRRLATSALKRLDDPLK